MKSSAQPEPSIIRKIGLVILDIDATKIVSEWWYVDTIASRTSAQFFGRALQVADGANHLSEGAQTTLRVNRPALAP